MSASLQSLLTPSKVVEVDYPDKPGFKINVAFQSREELIKLRKKCITTKYDRKTRQPVEELNEDLFIKNYVGSVIKGWAGLKYSYLPDLMLVDLSSIRDLDEELEYTEENALLLMKNSTEFDGFISDVVSDLSNFSKFASKT